MLQQIEKTQSPCGAADLLSAIFGVDPDKVRDKFGIPLKHPKRPDCPVCGRTVSKDGLCHCSHKILVACDNCGKLIERREKDVIWEANYPHKLAPNGYQHYFCNRKCFGQREGRHFGFGVHPGNTYPHLLGFGVHPGNTYPHLRKWDYDMVWQKHLETGYGARKLSRLLLIPEGTITVILRIMREKMKT